MKKQTKKLNFKAKEYQLKREIKQHKLCFWIGVIEVVFFWWTGIFFIIGIIMMAVGSSAKTRTENKLMELYNK